MTQYEMIYHRKSCRQFTGKPVDAEMIEKILSFELKPLYPQIKVRMDIVSRDKVKCICPWTTPQVITIYSEEKERMLTKYVLKEKQAIDTQGKTKDVTLFETFRMIDVVNYLVEQLNGGE